MTDVFTFWEGPTMPDYIRLCIRTWRFQYTVLTFNNLNQYTDLPIDSLLRFTLPQIADAVRVHVLRDHGGYWLDADTIMITDKLPEETLIGYRELDTCTAGFLHADRPHEPIFEAWAEYQDKIIADPNSGNHWSVLVNDFSDPYLREHKDITVAPVRNCWPETYVITDNVPRSEKYKRLYFEYEWNLDDLDKTDMLMLHNSWTPSWYKRMSAADVLKFNCTLSNILREVV